MWLAYAAGVLSEKGFNVDFIDASADGYALDKVIERSRNLKPDFIVLDTSTPSIYNDVEIAGKLKDEYPESFITLVGTHVSALPEEALMLNQKVDAVARHEYDDTLADLASTLKEGKTLEGVAGISYKNGARVIHNPQRPYLQDLDAIPFVSRAYKKFLNIENYFNPNALYPMVTITTSRGCPFPCTYCVYPQTLMGRGFRFRSPENVVEEMAYIVENFPQAKAVFFEDDTMTVNKQRCREISGLILKKGVRISWTANARVGLDCETMKIMKEAGCRSLCVGFESGNQNILDNIKKKIRLEELEQFMIGARRAGILIHGCFMAGLPGETKETLNETLNLAKKLEPDTVQFYPLMVYPGTEAYNWYQKKGFLQTTDFSKWITPEGLHNTVIRVGSLTPEALVAFCDQARRSFYLRPSYLFYKLKQMVLHPGEIKRTLKSARTFFKYLLRGSDLSS
jgi:radical SAM superfamily enzyme YgiQ (UPF0313 family)